MRLALPLVLTACAAHAQLQVSTLHIRVLNGRKGSPVKNASATMTVVPIGPYATPLERKTDAQGSFSMLVESDVKGDVQLRALVLRYPTCRYVPKADRKKPPMIYAVHDILTHGIVSDNRCSKRTVAPTPGELTLFVRPLHWWERLSY